MWLSFRRLLFVFTKQYKSAPLIDADVSNGHSEAAANS